MVRTWLGERSRLNIKINIPEDFERLPRDMELVVFRLVQECLTNIHRHSESQSAVIRIAREREDVVLEVQDQGKGISRERLAEIQAQRAGGGNQGNARAHAPVRRPYEPCGLENFRRVNRYKPEVATRRRRG
jgi:signal transduction histidine kinase